MDYSIAIIVPSSAVCETVRRVQKNIGCNYPCYAASNVAAVKIAKELLPKGVRMIISHGLTYQYLERDIPVPLLELPFGGLDTMASVKEALKASYRVVHVGTKPFYRFVKRSLEYLGVDNSLVAFCCLRMDKPLEDQVQDMVNVGYEAFIGGDSVVKYAKKMGKIGIPFDVDESIVETTILNARKLVEDKLQLEKQIELNDAILQASSDGIIAIDRKRNIISANLAALLIIHKPLDGILGHCLETVLRNSGIIDLEILKNKIDAVTENQIPVVLKELPIIVGNTQQGSVISIKEVSEIQNLEYRIREELVTKGLVAKKRFFDIAGESAAICQAKERAAIYAKYDSAVLIYGETGTGKELFAQSIHNASKRKHQPFVAINCATLPESLIESELFGYVKGAFTGANKEGKQGLFELANNGTIFLDEISELPLPIQSKLLRVLQEGEIIRIGGNKVIHVDTRVICSSNKNLLQLIREKKFKDDLYYRLCVLEIDIPPLRERPEDIKCLTHILLQKCAAKCEKNITGVSPDVFERLSRMPFMGNVRELNNIIERMVILAKDSVLDLKVLQKCDLRADSTWQGDEPLNELNFKDAQIQMIHSALKQCGGNKSAAAHLLGIDTSTLWRKMKTYSITY
jgi:transcriptional regulator with PAS, ATPase and Fis domain